VIFAATAAAAVATAYDDYFYKDLQTKWSPE